MIAKRGAAEHARLADAVRASYRSGSMLGLDADGHAVVPLQRDLLHLRAHPENFYGVASGARPYYFFPFAAGNLLGPLLLGRFFDTIGRRKMIALHLLLAGVLLAVSGWLFHAGALTATTQTIFWCAIFFIASAAASSAYLTVSEIFPLEMRAQAISLIFSIAQGFGALGSAVFGAIVAAATKEQLVEERAGRGGGRGSHAARGGLRRGRCHRVHRRRGRVVPQHGPQQKYFEDVATPLTAVEPPHVTPIEVPAGPHPPHHRHPY